MGAGLVHRTARVLSSIAAVAFCLTWVTVAGPGTPLAAGATTRQGATPPPLEESLNSMLWLAGQWRSEEGGQLSEETWSVPHGGSMVGMWRLVADGAPRVIELLSLTVEGNNVVLRLRHFDARLVAREDKTAPLTLKRVKSGEKMAVFEGAGSNGPLTISYRVEGSDLVGTVRHAAGDPETYRMRRVSFGPTMGIAR